MWRIFNWLFGWHYILVHDGLEHDIVRVHLMPDGTLCGALIGRMVFIDFNGEITGGYQIHSWRPLTFTMDQMPGNHNVADLKVVKE